MHPVVAAYRTLSRGVDGVNQMALHEAGWPPDDMGPRSVCVRAPERGCEGVRNLPAIWTLQGDP